MEAQRSDGHRSVAAQIDPPQMATATRLPPSISLVLPAYNEAETIVQAIREADTALARITSDYEIIVVDDGSSDSTAARATAEAEQLKSVRIVQQPENLGYGAALRRGFQTATKELVGFTDADCQFNLRELDRLVLLTADYDIVCGYRIDRQDPLRRKFFSASYNLLVRLLLRTGVRDCDCALKLFRRDVIQQLDLEADGFLFNADLLVKARLQGRSIVEVGVSHRPRPGGESTVSFGQAVPVGSGLLRLAWKQVFFPGPARSQDIEHASRSHGMQSLGLLVLAAIGALLLFYNLSYPLIEPDETRYAQIALEAVESGNYTTPTLQGKLYLDKPPLLYWLTAASYRLFGISQQSARLPSALAAWLTVLMTFWLGRRLVGPRGAWVGALLLLLSGGFVMSGRFLIMDGLLTLLTTLCLLLLYLGSQQARFRPGWWLAAGVACGLGVLTKGPVAAVLCLPPMVATLWLAGSPFQFRWRDWLWFAVPTLLISLPWYVAIVATQPAFAGYFFFEHHLVRFFGPFVHTQPWWFYLPVILLAMFPSSMLIPPLGFLLASRSESLRRLRSPEFGFLVLTSVWIVGFYSLSQCKLPTYVLPALPLLCLLLGRMVDGVLLERHCESRYLRWVVQRFPLHAVVIILGITCSLGVAGWLIDGELGAGWWLDASVVVVTGSFLTLLVAIGLQRRRWSWRSGRPVLGLVPDSWFGGLRPGSPLTASAKLPQPQTVWGLVAVIALVATAYVYGGFFPKFSAQRSIQLQAAQLRQRLGGEPIPVIYVGDHWYAASFYTAPRDLWYFELHQLDQVRAMLQEHPQAVIVTKCPAEKLARSLGPQVEIVSVGRRGRVYASRLRLPATRAAEQPPSPRRSLSLSHRQESADRAR